MTSVTDLYQQTLRERGYTADPAQLRAVASLQRCQDEWAAYKARRGNAITKMLVPPPIPRGVYMYGGVGRGKSFLMDCFFQAVPLQRKTRLHFHEFMREVHRELQELKGTVNPLDELGKRIARKLPADLLRRVPRGRRDRRDDPAPVAGRAVRQPGVDRHHQQLPARRAVPQRPAPRPHPAGHRAAQGATGSHQRRQRHRLPPPHAGAGPAVPHPLGPAADAALEATFNQLAEARDENPLLHIEHREMKAVRRAGGVVWFDFKHPVRRPAVAERLPRAGPAVPHRACCQRAADAARMASEARRFTWLVDVLYDRRVKLVISAAVPAEQLYTEGPLAHEFPRTVSRLQEMQSAELPGAGAGARSTPH
jgi:cell division protein ZapE